MLAIFSQSLRNGFPSRRIILTAIIGLNRWHVRSQRFLRRFSINAHRVGLPLFEYRKILELVETILIGSGRFNRVTVDIHYWLTIWSNKLQNDILDALLILILDSVTVFIDPDVVTNGDLRSNEPEVQGWITLTVFSQVTRLSFPSRGIFISIGAVFLGWHVRSQWFLRRVLINAHRVGLPLFEYRKILELVETILIGSGRFNRVTVDIHYWLTIWSNKLQNDILDALLILILDSVTVFIDPDIVTNGNLRGNKSEVQGWIVLPVFSQPL